MVNGPRTVKSRRVSDELRRYRELAGLTVTDAARRLDMSQGQLSRIELGTRGLKVCEVATMLGMYGAPARKVEELLNLVREAAEPGWWAPTGAELPADWQTFIDFERRAVSLVNYESLRVPGLLQTPDYARAIIQGTAETELSEKELDTKVSARIGRQGILTRPNPPHLEVLLYEPALRIPIGEPPTMRRQLRHLRDMTERRSIEVRVIPMAACAHPGLDAPHFVIMEFDDQPALVYTDGMTRSAFLEEGDLKAYRMALQRLRHLALSPEESTELMDRVAADLS